MGVVVNLKNLRDAAGQTLEVPCDTETSGCQVEDAIGTELQRRGFPVEAMAVQRSGVAMQDFTTTSAALLAPMDDLELWWWPTEEWKAICERKIEEDMLAGISSTDATAIMIAQRWRLAAG